MASENFLLTNLLTEDARKVTSITHHIAWEEKRVGIQQIASAPLLSITSIVKMCKPWALPYPHPQSDGVHLSHFPRLPEPAACSLPRGNVPPLCAITYDGTIYRKKTA